MRIFLLLISLIAGSCLRDTLSRKLGNTYYKHFDIFTLQSSTPLPIPDSIGWSYGIRPLAHIQQNDVGDTLRYSGVHISLYYNGTCRDEIAALYFYNNPTYSDYYVLKSSYEDSPFPNKYYTELTWSVCTMNKVVYIAKHYADISKGFVNPIELIARYPEVDTVYRCPPWKDREDHLNLYFNQNAFRHRSEELKAKRKGAFYSDLPVSFDKYYQYRILKTSINDTLAVYKYEYPNGTTRTDTLSLDRPLNWYWNKNEWNNKVIQDLQNYKSLHISY
jgi:hypothetical protein